MFVLTPLVMVFPLSAGGLAFEDALFEAVSAITTTGLSTAGSVEGLSPTLLFSRSWMQWFGGLGIAVLSVALLMGQHAAARRLAEPTEVDNIATTARRQARQVLQRNGLRDRVVLETDGQLKTGRDIAIAALPDTPQEIVFDPHLKSG